MAIRISALVTSIILLSSCAPRATDEEILTAVLLVGHATGSTMTRSINARADLFPGTFADTEAGIAEFDRLDLGVFELDVPYTELSGEVALGPVEIGQATIRLVGGPIEEISFGYATDSLLSGEWTVEGRVDGRRFEIAHDFDDVREFRTRRR